MRSPSRPFSLFLLAVMLLTLLAPRFGWEAAASMSPHLAGQGQTDPHEHAYHHADVDEHVGDDCGHGCAGHMFSHLQILHSEALVAGSADAAGGYSASVTPAPRGAEPQGLFRPPRPAFNA